MSANTFTIGGIEFAKVATGTVVQAPTVDVVEGTLLALPVTDPKDETRQLLPFATVDGEQVLFSMPANWDFSRRGGLTVGVLMWIRRGYDSLAGRTSYDFGLGSMPDAIEDDGLAGADAI
jgi:hypothetical protein